MSRPRRLRPGREVAPDVEPPRGGPQQVVLQAHSAGEVACTVLRPGDVYGPGSYFWTATPVRELRARRLVLPAMGRGRVSAVYVDDLVEGAILAAGEPGAAGHVFTLSGGHDVQAREFSAATHACSAASGFPPRRPEQ